MNFQDSSFNGLKVTVGAKSVNHPRTHAPTHAPKAICPINFFKVGGITTYTCVIGKHRPEHAIFIQVKRMGYKCYMNLVNLNILFVIFVFDANRSVIFLAFFERKPPNVLH